ncbi:cupin domain-containing protein [Fulvivirgaceae bacterium BMA12]|uniref:Cupin domain-containing protein n=1 Tax=Agaribacillus aureus TaxID=3051825 RepID=A0ABT8L7W5_9BACT|nr:cupin domain-containing protein [Fulvivirgaceae bacterium BMA12]
MKYLLLILIMISFIFKGYTQDPAAIESRVYHWEEIGIDTSRPGAMNPVFEGVSDGFEYLNIFLATVGKGASFKLPINNDSLESLIIMKTGQVNQHVGHKNRVMGPGSVTLVMPGEKPRIDNNGDNPANFYVILWRVKDFYNGHIPESNQSIPSHLINWQELTYEKTAKGGYRHVIRQPTSMLTEFEMHVTTLEEGKRSHPPHTHLDEEIILVRFGEVEESIDGKLYDADEGSLIFLRSMVPHGIRNIGKGSCEYYAFRWIPKK